MSRRGIILLVITAGLAVVGCGGSPDVAAPSSGPTERTPSSESGEPTVALAGPDDACLDAAACEDTAAAAPGGTAPEGRREREESPDMGASAGPPNGRPVPKVVGAPLEAACRTLRRSQYHGRVFSAEGAGVPGPRGTPVAARRVVEQLPEPGSEGAAVDAPVYLGVPGPLPGRLPAETPCPRRVFRNLPANFPTLTDE